MRALVIILNVLSILAAAAIEPVAFYVGAWGLLGPAYGDNGSAALGVAIMAAPPLIAGTCLWLSLRRVRGLNPDSIVIAATPLILVVGALLIVPPMFASR